MHLCGTVSTNCDRQLKGNFKVFKIHELICLQGTGPFTWSLISPPSTMTVSGGTGTLLWSRAVASVSPYSIVVSCSSLYGSSQMTFSLSVPLSYSAVLDPLPPGPFTQPQPVLISGKLVWTTAASKSYFSGTDIPVNIL